LACWSMSASNSSEKTTSTGTESSIARSLVMSPFSTGGRINVSRLSDTWLTPLASREDSQVLRNGHCYRVKYRVSALILVALDLDRYSTQRGQNSVISYSHQYQTTILQSEMVIPPGKIVISRACHSSLDG
jgi:hypothetical protein